MADGISPTLLTDTVRDRPPAYMALYPHRSYPVA